MRPHDSFTRDVLGASAIYGVSHWLKVKVANASNTWKELTNLEGENWVTSVECGEDVDNPVGTFTVRLRRDTTANSELSLAPTIGASALNRDDAAAYAPLLAPARAIKILCCATLTGTTPSDGDYIELFSGAIDKLEWGTDEIVVEGRDDAGWLVDNLIKVDRTYANVTPMDIEDVMQAILDDQAYGSVILHTPVSPSYLINNAKGAPEPKKSTFERLQEYAQLIGWMCRFRYDTDGVSKLTFYDPDRARTAVDTTFGPSEYEDIPSLALGQEDIRNDIQVFGFDEDGEEISTAVSDLPSIGKYGLRSVLVYLEQGDLLNTSVELEAFANAMLADLKEPLATQEMRTLLFWPVQLGDRYTYAANDVHYDDPQTLAVVGYKHVFANGQAYTTIQARGTVAGQYHQWLKRRHDQPLPNAGGQAKRPGVIEFVVSEPQNSAISGAPVWAYGAQFKLMEYTGFTGDTLAAKHFGSDWTQDPIASLDPDDLPWPVVVTLTINGVATDWRPSYDSGTDVFAIYASLANGTNFGYKITANGNTYTLDFSGPDAPVQTLVLPPQEGRATSANASAYLSNNRTFNAADFMDAYASPADALQAAADAAYAAGGRAYLELPDLVTLDGDVNVERNVSIVGPGVGELGLANDGTMRYLNIIGAEPAKHLIKDLTLTGVGVRYGNTSSDYGRSCSMQNVLIQGCSTQAVRYRHHSYLTRLDNVHLTGNAIGVKFDFGAAGSDSGANMVISNSVIDDGAELIVIDGMTADGCQIFIRDTDLEHSTSSCLKTINADSAGEAMIFLNGVNLELNTGVIFDNDGAQIWLENFVALSVTETMFLKQTAGLFFIDKGRWSWLQNKLVQLTGGKVIIQPGMLFAASRFHGEGSAGSGSGFGAAVPYAVSGSGGGKIILPGQHVYRAQTNQVLTTLTNAAPGPVTASVWWKLDGNNRTWELDVDCPFTGSPTSNTLRITLTNGVTTVRHDVAFPLFAGRGRLTLTNIAGSVFKVVGTYVETASGKASAYYGTTSDYSSATDTDRSIALETLGTTKAPMTVTVLTEDVTGPIFVGL